MSQYHCIVHFRFFKAAVCLATLAIFAGNSNKAQASSGTQGDAPAVTDEFTATEGFEDCPAYGTQGARFLPGWAERQWAQVAALTNQVYGNQSTSFGSLNPPRNNFIDDYIFGRAQRDGVPIADVCTDEEFIRRVSLDLAGRIPTAAEVESFASNPSPTKRADLIEALLSSQGYVDRMTNYLGDLLENTFTALGSGRTLYYSSIKDFVSTNQPYNEFVTSILTSSGANDVNGPVNFMARAWEMMANRLDEIDNTVAEAGKDFLGVPMMCVTCHGGAGHIASQNHYFGNVTRLDFWGMAAFYGQLNYTRAGMRYNFEFDTYAGEIGYRTNGPGSAGGVRPARTPARTVESKYLFTGEPPENGVDRRSEFARFVTTDRQFARATTNYLFQLMFGMGIVEPADGFDLDRLDPDHLPEGWTLQPTHPDLLESLADAFIASGYDIKAMIRLMANSTAYQLSAEFPVPWESRFVQYFTRHFARRMTAEQLLDSVFQATNLPETMATRDLGNVQWAMQLPDPTEPTGGGINATVRNFLGVLFRGNRNDQPRSTDGSILQTLSLMNDATLIVNKTRATGGGLVQTLVDSGLPNEEIVNQMFLATASRLPTAEERSQALSILEADRAAGAEDLMWTLLNSLFFIFY